MAAIRIPYWALIFIIKLRFPPALSLDDVLKLRDSWNRHFWKYFQQSFYLF